MEYTKNTSFTSVTEKIKEIVKYIEIIMMEVKNNSVRIK